MERKIKLCRMTTVPISLGILMEGQLEYMREQGFEVTGLSSPGEWLDRIQDERGIRTLATPMTRTLSPFSDLVSLYRLYRIFRHERFDIVHSHTPKAGLLGMMAARAAGVPVRIHTFATVATDDMPEFRWKVVRYTDKITALFSTHCLAISHSLRDIMVERKTCPPEKIEVLLSGSSNGIDLERFTPTEQIQARAEAIRKDLGLGKDCKVILFIGRVVQEKGVAELVEAFKTVSAGRKDFKLVLVGPWEQELDPVPEPTVREIESNPDILSVGYQHDVEAYLTLCDVMAVPSYREGFGNVFIQAAAMEKPVIATKIPGVVNAVQDGINGLLVPPRRTEPLAHALSELLDDPDRRRAMGRAGRKWVTENFDRRLILAALEKTYRDLCAMHLT